MLTHTYAICAYKDSPYLEACIRSLLRQTIPASVILCTSTPSPYLQRTAKKYGLPFFVRDGESDIQDDWNFAYEKAASRLVTIAHQDDIYHKDYGKYVQLGAVSGYSDFYHRLCGEQGRKGQKEGACASD